MSERHVSPACHGHAQPELKTAEQGLENVNAHKTDAEKQSAPGEAAGSGAPNTSAEVPNAALLAVLVQNHRAFIDYVQGKVGSRALAEEIVQEAFVRGLQREPAELDSTIAWFYRVLHNAAIDQLRRAKSQSKGLSQFAEELASEPSAEQEATRVVCECVKRLAQGLKPEYAEALRQVEVEGTSVKDYAQALGISTSNASVRLFRAREALRKEVTRSCGTCAEHGCFDCSCSNVAHAE